jgi:hypothetical protein
LPFAICNLDNFPSCWLADTYQPNSDYEEYYQMLDFAAVKAGKLTFGELTADLAVDDLRDLTNEMIDFQLGLISDCSDEDVVFVPDDPEANDPVAADPEDIDLAWNLGHVIVHVTASSEEAAAFAAELARGVPHRGGRSRSEVPWEIVTTIAQCRQRLEESRRMRLASLDMWPDKPFLDNTFQYRTDGDLINSVGRFVGGLRHDTSHLEHIAHIIKQAHAARQ